MYLLKSVMICKNFFASCALKIWGSPEEQFHRWRFKRGCSPALVPFKTATLEIVFQQGYQAFSPEKCNIELRPTHQTCHTLATEVAQTYH